jgi:hypothetical protein
MEHISPPGAVHFRQVRRLTLPLAILSMLMSGCALGSTLAGESGATATQPVQSEPATTAPTPQPATLTPGGTGVETVRQGSLDFCFSFPQGYTLLPFGESVEVVGPHSGSGPEPGMMWIDVGDAQGRTAEDAANEELSYVGGSNPPRYTVLLGGEEAVVFDGMPGQNLVRRVYIVHAGKLIIPTFSPYGSDNAFANDQMEALYAAVTSSWVWISSGAPCTPGS